MNKLKLIVAIGKNRELGKDNKLLWHIPDDLRFFSKKTTNNIVVMGRKSWESLPSKYRPLPNRLNIVLSRELNTLVPGAEVFNSLDEVYQKYLVPTEDRSIYIIGGSEIYKLVLEHKVKIDEMFITYIDTEAEADKFFPIVNESEWNKEEILSKPALEHSFKIIKFIRK